MNIGNIFGGIVQTIGSIFGGSASDPSASPTSTPFGYSGQSSFDPTASSSQGASSSGGAAGDPNWFSKAVLQVILNNITQMLEDSQQEFKKAYPDGL